MNAAERSDLTRASWGRIQAGEGYLYAARLPDGVIKIGFALDPERRVLEFKGQLIATTRGTREEEHALHRKLLAFRVPNYGGRPGASEFYVPAALTHGSVPDGLKVAVLVHPRPLRLGTRQKAHRDAEVIALHDGGRLTLQEVGDKLGLTRERVRQILARNNIDCRRGNSVPLEICQERFDRYQQTLLPGVRTKDALRAAGLKLEELRVACRKLGVQLPKAVRSERLRYRQIANYYEANPSVTGVDVARHFHVSQNAVSKALQEMGVISRQAGWRHKRTDSGEAQ